MELSFIILSATYVLLTVYKIVQFNCNQESEKDNPTFFEKIYVNMRKTIGTSFQYWAENIICKYPKTTLLVTILWVMFCCAGFPQTEFTTDPVELWVNPESQNARELNFYNQKFDPFYA